MNDQDTIYRGGPPRDTIWGSPQGGWKKIADGIFECCTASHGGIWLSAERLAAMPAELRAESFNGNSPWFEEDSDWALVVRAFPECFTEAQRGHAERDRLYRIKSKEAEALRRPKDICSALSVKPIDFLPDHRALAISESHKGPLCIVLSDDRTGKPELAIVRGYSELRTAGHRQPIIEECTATGLAPTMLDPDSHAARCYLQRYAA